MFPQARPSQVTQRDSQASLPVPSEDLNTSLIRRYLATHGHDPSRYGSGNALFLSLAALVELHLSKPSLNEPFFTGLLNLEPGNIIRLKYYSGSSTDEHGLRVETSLLWSRLRTDVDEQRTTLRWMPRFVKTQFDVLQTELETALNELTERFELHSQELEIAETRLRDHIAIQSSQQGTRMAAQSIRESKRVMLRKSF
jgi:hypothetical protein